jgi:hypothetical protein
MALQIYKKNNVYYLNGSIVPVNAYRCDIESIGGNDYISIENISQKTKVINRIVVTAIKKESGVYYASIAEFITDVGALFCNIPPAAITGYATETTLQSVDARLTTLNAKDFATQTTLQSVSSNTDSTSQYCSDIADNTSTIITKISDGSQLTKITDGAGTVTTKQLGNQLTNIDVGLVTNTIIHGLTTGGGGGYVDVKVTPSGALTVESTIANDVALNGVPITGQTLEAGGSNVLGWLSSIRKKITDVFSTLTTTLTDGSQKTKIVDSVTTRGAYVSFLNALKTESTTRLVGPNFMGSTFDTNFWTSIAVNGGTNTVANGMVLLQTNTTANGTAGFNSVRLGRFMFACPNIFRGIFRLVSAGVTDNKRKWGVWNGTDGFYFQINNSTFSIGYQRSGASETLVNNGAFNNTSTVTIDTNVHAYEIHYFVMKVEFYIDAVLIHTLIPTTQTLTATMSLPIYIANINSNNSITNVGLECWNASILRIGNEHHSNIVKNIVGASTTVLKYGAGHIDKLFINSSVNGTITIYDNTAASGTTIATITTPANSVIGTALDQINFYIGLTIVTSNGGHNVTIDYE